MGWQVHVMATRLATFAVRHGAHLCLHVVIDGLEVLQGVMQVPLALPSLRQGGIQGRVHQAVQLQRRAAAVQAT